MTFTMHITYVTGFNADNDEVSASASPGASIRFLAPKGQYSVGQTITVTVS